MAVPSPDQAARPNDRLSTQIAIVGCGPGGAVTGMLLSEAGYDVVLLEEGPHLPLGSAPHFSMEEMTQKCRNGGITVGFGKVAMAYVEGCCVGGGSEVNRGLYNRTPPEVLEDWRREHLVEALTPEDLAPHFEACEQVARISYLPGDPPPTSRKLREGAKTLGWECVEVPRLVTYETHGETGHVGKKESMSATFVPRCLAAGGRILPGTRAARLTRNGGRWRIRAESSQGEPRPFEIEAETVFVACGAIETPSLLRRSGITRNVGDTLRFHPMIKVVAQFTDEVNAPGQLDPVHQVREFDPRFSMGCSISSRPALAMAMVDHPDNMPEIDRYWRHMAIYYAQSTGGRAVVRNLPGYHDPLVRLRLAPADLRELAEGLRRLCECLFAAGAVAIYPGIANSPILRGEADLALLPEILPSRGANLSTLHLFSTCRMGRNRSQCVADSFGRVYDADQLYVADASLLCGPTVVNPQASVMAVAHRNATDFLERDRRSRRSMQANQNAHSELCNQ